MNTKLDRALCVFLDHWVNKDAIENQISDQQNELEELRKSVSSRDEYNQLVILPFLAEAQAYAEYKDCKTCLFSGSAYRPEESHRSCNCSKLNDSLQFWKFNHSIFLPRTRFPTSSSYNPQPRELELRRLIYTVEHGSDFMFYEFAEGEADETNYSPTRAASQVLSLIESNPVFPMPFRRRANRLSVAKHFQT